MVVNVLIVTEKLDVVYARFKNLIYANNVTGFNIAITQIVKGNALNALKIHAKTVISPIPVNALYAQARIIMILHLSANLVLRTVLSAKITKFAINAFMVLGWLEEFVGLVIFQVVLIVIRISILVHPVLLRTLNSTLLTGPVF